MSRTQNKAVIYRDSEIRLETGAAPRPAADEVLVEMRAVGICGSDVAYFGGTSKYSVSEPFVMGHEASAVIVDLGETTAVNHEEKWEVGARVALVPGRSCGTCNNCRTGLDNLCNEARYLGSAATRPPTNGALQTYVAVPRTHLLRLPDNVSFATGALLEPLGVAEHAVNVANVAGKTLLITGGGSIGQLIALVAKAAGARGVTLCEVHERRRQLALDHAADYSMSPHEIDAEIRRGRRFDVALDATGNEAAVDQCLRALKPRVGLLVLVGNLPRKTRISPEVIARSELSVTATHRFPGGLGRALALVKSGLQVDWLVERTAKLSEIEDALRRAGAADAPIKTQITSFH